MSYSLGYHIRERLATYLAGKISLREFEDWFFPETWDVDQIDNLDLLNLVYGIKLRLAEFSNGKMKLTPRSSSSNRAGRSCFGCLMPDGACVKKGRFYLTVLTLSKHKTVKLI